MNPVALLAIATVVLPSMPAAAQELRQIGEVLEYGRQTEVNTDSADRLFDALENAAQEGVPIKLGLSLAPGVKSGGDLDKLGYQMIPLGDAYEPERVACGKDLSGVVDNYRTDYTISFNHPDNNRYPTTIQVGERHDFPFNALTCTFARGPDYPMVLFLVGTFTVTRADMAPATVLHLFPYKP